MSVEAPVQVFLAGEGPNEIGNRAAHAAYRIEARPGVLEVLLRRERIAHRYRPRQRLRSWPRHRP